MRTISHRVVLVSIIIALVISIGFIIFFSRLNVDEPVKIAVIDSGCGLNQDPRVVEYVSFVNTSYGYETDELIIYDVLDHGNKVCEIILESTVNTVLYSVKIAQHTGTLTYEALFASIAWAVGRGVDIINLSLGAPGILTEELISTIEAYANDTIIVAASGNTGSNDYNTYGLGDWPANLPFIMGVGAYSPNDTTPAFYTSRGRTYNNYFVTDFSAEGSYDNAFGTSFSAPHITSEVANLMINLGTEFSYSQIYAMLARSGSLWPSYSPVLGWGLPNGSNAVDDELVVINGYDWSDDKPRFSDELWSQIWYVSSTVDIELDEFVISGNGSDIATPRLVPRYWGNELVIDFEPTTNQSSQYILEINHPRGNSFSYSFTIQGPSNGSVLMDYRTTVNGYGHEYGEYLNAELFMRSQGYMVDHLFFDETVDLDQYDLVIAPKFFQKEFAITRYITRDYNSDLLDEYSDYVRDGGFFMPMLDVDNKIRIDDLNVFLDNFGIEVINDGIHKDYNPVSIQNFSSSAITENVVNLEFLGVGISSSNTNITDLGWFKKIKSNILSYEAYYLSIGVYGNYGNGRILVMGSSYGLINYSFINNYGVHFDKFLLNVLGEL